jgi:hypothetical protein
MEQWEKPGLGQRWNQARPSKGLVFSSWVGCAVVTMIVGFTWGGWVTGGTARSMAEETVVARLAPICVVQFNKDPGKGEKLKELKEAGSWRGGEYVTKQGWATMPGEQEPTHRVAEECARLLMLTAA